HRVRNVRVRHATETLESDRVPPPGTVVWHPGPDHRLGDWCGIVKAAGRTDAFVASASEPVAWTVGSADPATGQVPRLGLNVPIVRADRGLWGKKDGRYTSDGYGTLAVGVNRCHRPWQRHEIVMCDLRLPEGSGGRRQITIESRSADRTSITLR